MSSKVAAERLLVQLLCQSEHGSKEKSLVSSKASFVPSGSPSEADERPRSVALQLVDSNKFRTKSTAQNVIAIYSYQSTPADFRGLLNSPGDLNKCGMIS